MNWDNIVQLGIIKTDADETAFRVLADTKYKKLKDSVYAWLAQLPPGQSYTLKGRIKENNLPLFIRMVCLFIIDYKPEKNANIIDYYVFTSDYQHIKHIYNDFTPRKNTRCIKQYARQEDEPSC